MLALFLVLYLLLHLVHYPTYIMIYSRYTCKFASKNTTLFIRL